MSIHHPEVIAASVLAMRATPKPTRKQMNALRMLAQLRAEAEAEIERLLEFLDKTEAPEGDDADDPRGEFCDCYLEGDDCDQEGSPSEDVEPSLGWTADGRNGHPTDASSDECEAGFPPATRVIKKPEVNRLDNFTASRSFSRERMPRIRKGKPGSSPGIGNVGPIIASWKVR